MAMARGAPAVGSAAASAEGALRSAAARLTDRAGGLSGARLEAEVLLAQLLGLTRAQLLLHGDLTRAQRSSFELQVSRRVDTGVPVSYLTGRRGFRDLELLVDERVLVPRPETEGVVDLFEELLAAGQVPAGHLVDRGTGSGNIALAVCAKRPVLGTDLSPDALEVAALNRRDAPQGARLSLVRADGLGFLRPASVAAVLANPPYVEQEEVAALPEDVRCHEPLMALVPSEGTAQAMYERLLDESHAALRPGGWLVTEVGAEQASLVAGLASARGYGNVTVRADLAGIDRIVAGRRP
jgi:release factor glutamine methyltransferase